MSKNVDFTSAEAIEAELAAAEQNIVDSEATATAKVKKPKVLKVTFVADRDIAAGEEITFDYTVPVGTRHIGINAGIPLDEMSAEQLKIEYRNANSVLYKTKKAQRDTTAAEERCAKVIKAMEAKGLTPGQRASAPAKIDAAVVANLIKNGQLSADDIQALLDAE